MQNWLGSILGLIAAAGSIFSPQLQGWESHHPAVVGSILSALAVINHLLPSPVGGGSNQSGS